MVVLLAPLVWHYEAETFSHIPNFTTNMLIGLVLPTVFHNFLSMIFFYGANKIGGYTSSTFKFFGSVRAN